MKKLKIEEPKPPRLLSSTNFSCTKDSDCGPNSVCLPGRLLSESGQAYQNALFEKQGYSITDVTVLGSSLYFLLDEDKIGIVEPQKETSTYRLPSGPFTAIITFREEVYLRGTTRLYRFIPERHALTEVSFLPPIQTLSVTPDGNYLYLNDALYGNGFQVILKFPSVTPRFFLSPETYLTIEETKSYLTVKGEVMSNVTLPEQIAEAAFGKEGDLYILEAGKDRKINIIAGELFTVTNRVCAKI